MDSTLSKKNEKYLDWVRDQDCVLCLQSGPSEAHHVKGEFHLSGVGLKAPDFFTMPLCQGCHQMIHDARGDWRDAQREGLIWTIIRAYREGMIAIT